jgi:hypothetical protein
MLATLDNQAHQEWEQITASRIDTPTTAELVTSWNRGAGPWSYYRIHSHQVRLLPIHELQHQLEAMSVNFHTAM